MSDWLDRIIEELDTRVEDDNPGDPRRSGERRYGHAVHLPRRREPDALYRRRYPRHHGGRAMNAPEAVGYGAAGLWGYGLVLFTAVMI